MDYGTWYEKYGYKIDRDILNWFNDIPDCIDLDSLNICCVRDFIEERLEYEYESFISDDGDRAYDEWKDRDI